MIYYITEQDVRDKLPVDYSLLSGNILPSITQAQEINVRDLTGDKLYNAINEKIIDGSITGSTNTNYKKLLDEYLVPTTLYYTSVYLLTNNLAKLQNRGIQIQNSEFSSSADLAVYRQLKSEFSELAEYYTTRAKDYLYFNQNLFPQFTYYEGDGTQGASSSYKYSSGGLVLGQRPRFSYNNMSWRGKGGCC